MAATPSTATSRPAPAAQPDWELTAERGPDWLFVKFEATAPAPRASSRLTESIWDMIREHGANRVVLELDGVERPDNALWESIAEVGARMRDAGGLIRISGLSQDDRQTHPTAPNPAAVPCFASRTAAVGTRSCPEGRCE